MFALIIIVAYTVPMDLDVKMKAVMLGATFLIVSISIKLSTQVNLASSQGPLKGRLRPWYTLIAHAPSPENLGIRFILVCLQILCVYVVQLVTCCTLAL